MALAKVPSKEEEGEFIFPSGSDWGILQLERLNFPLQPETHPFIDLSWEHELGNESRDILNQLRHGFGLHQDEWVKGSVDGIYKDFYDDLADMLSRAKAKQLTPRKPAVRSNTNLPSSSDHQPSSPWSVGGTKGPPSYSAGRNPSIDVSSIENWRNSDSDPAGYESDVEIISTPTPKRLREDFIKSPSLPARMPTPISGSATAAFIAPEAVESTPTPTPKRLREYFTKSPSIPARMPTPISGSTTVPFIAIELTSSQTDSTIQSAGHASSVSDDERSEGDRPEIDVTILIRSLLKRICEAHGNRNGYSFSVGNDVETLVIPICGDFPKTIPDMIIRMHLGKKIYSIVDYEVCILLYLSVAELIH